MLSVNNQTAVVHSTSKTTNGKQNQVPARLFDQARGTECPAIVTKIPVEHSSDDNDAGTLHSKLDTIVPYQATHDTTCHVSSWQKQKDEAIKIENDTNLFVKIFGALDDDYITEMKIEDIIGSHGYTAHSDGI